MIAELTGREEGDQGVKASMLGFQSHVGGKIEEKAASNWLIYVICCTVLDRAVSTSSLRLVESTSCRACDLSSLRLVELAACRACDLSSLRLVEPATCRACDLSGLRLVGPATCRACDLSGLRLVGPARAFDRNELAMKEVVQRKERRDQ